VAPARQQWPEIEPGRLNGLFLLIALQPFVASLGDEVSDSINRATDGGWFKHSCFDVLSQLGRSGGCRQSGLLRDNRPGETARKIAIKGEA
jgi:hypothetical protein